MSFMEGGSHYENETEIVVFELDQETIVVDSDGRSHDDGVHADHGMGGG